MISTEYLAIVYGSYGGILVVTFILSYFKILDKYVSDIGERCHQRLLSEMSSEEEKQHQAKESSP